MNSNKVIMLNGKVTAKNAEILFVLRKYLKKKNSL